MKQRLAFVTGVLQEGSYCKLASALLALHFKALPAQMLMLICNGNTALAMHTSHVALLKGSGILRTGSF